MDTEDKGQSGYYQTIAREFLARRGAPFFLSPRDQSAIASWESRRVPLRVVLEGIGRAFDGLKTRGRGTKGISLAHCDRQVDDALAQHLDRSAGRRNTAGPRPRKKDRARREVEKGLHGLAPDDREIARLLEAALEILDAPKPDEAALERIDSEVEELLWGRATGSEKGAAEAEARKGLRGRRPEGIEAMIRRQVVKELRAGRKIPHVSLYYY
ncbi:MAG: hypothetical protein A2Y70_04955 [Candidatus Aminicenantes bacterium RBG_13_64_14]|nr:MAG: hypothetical protein A2Y70_04955 [Candidatus Aminicenantes bacterium RBG_13_64_14]